MLIDLTPAAWTAITAALLLGYTVFGLSGFGAQLIAVPVLALFLPLKVAVPMLLLLDLVATLGVGASNWREVRRDELGRLLPGMVAGIGLGVTVLVGAPAKPLLVTLGVFVLLQMAWNLASPAARGSANPWWSLPAGVFGGVFSGLFGTGGVIYAIYLARRIPQASGLRATMSVVILTSVFIRLGIFAWAGLFSQPGLAGTAMALLPCSLLGVWLGSRLHGRWSPARVRQVFLALVTLGGLGALLKGLAS